MKKMKITGMILLVCIFVIACSSRRYDECQIEYKDPNAIYKVAWQYIVAQINGADIQVSDAKIDRMELVDTHNASNNLSVSIYALEYSYSLEGESGFFPGSTSKGSPYLFIKNIDGTPQVLGVRFTKDILSEGGFSKNAQIIINENCNTDFAKHSTSSAVFQPGEIEEAVEEAEKYYNENEDIILINTWFDETRYQNDIMEFWDNTLYGMDEAAKRDDLIILYNDLYASDLGIGHLSCNWKTIMIRDGVNEPWKVVTAGY